MLRTGPYSLTNIHTNRRGVVVQALIAILGDTDLPRRHASPKLVAGLCRASKQHKARANCALHAQSCGVVLIKVGKQHHTGAVGDVAGTGVAEFKQIHVGRRLGSSCAGHERGSTIVAWAASDVLVGDGLVQAGGCSRTCCLSCARLASTVQSEKAFQRDVCWRAQVGRRQHAGCARREGQEGNACMTAVHSIPSDVHAY
jgi:hypothetical protein